jgi:hypothetical protein
MCVKAEATNTTSRQRSIYSTNADCDTVIKEAQGEENLFAPRGGAPFWPIIVVGLTSDYIETLSQYD